MSIVVALSLRIRSRVFVVERVPWSMCAMMLKLRMEAGPPRATSSDRSASDNKHSGGNVVPTARSVSAAEELSDASAEAAEADEKCRRAVLCALVCAVLYPAAAV